MESQDDGALLSRYAIDEDQDAFRVLTERYGSLVYSVCRRRIGRSDLAEDAAQVVFLILARSSRRLAARRTIAPWLYSCSVNVSRSILRSEARRRRYEREALGVRSDEDGSGHDVESALARLRGKDRDAIVLRFLHGNSLAEVAGALGVSEDAARMRVNRALAKLKSDLGPAPAELLIGSALPIPRSLVGTPSEFLKVLPHRYSRLIGGHTFMTSLPAFSFFAVLILGGGAATLKIGHGKPDPNKPAPTFSLPAMFQSAPAAPSGDVLKDIQLEILGTWNATLGSEDGGRTTNMKFPHTVIRAGKAKGELVMHADQPSTSVGSMDADWHLDMDRQLFYFLTEEAPDGPPLKLVSSTLNRRKEKVAIFEGKSKKSNYKLTLTFTHNRFEFVVTGRNLDGSKLTPEQVSMTFERL